MDSIKKYCKEVEMALDDEAGDLNSKTFNETADWKLIETYVFRSYKLSGFQ